MSVRHLDRLLTPTRVAVIGASDRVGSVGATVWRNLRAGRFTGATYPVNPRLSTLDGVAVFAHAADLPQPPDLAVICTPPAGVAALVEQLGRLGTRAAIVMTAGARPRAEAGAARRRPAASAAHPGAQLPRSADPAHRPERQLRAHRRVAGRAGVRLAVLVKAGRAGNGLQAAASHTGALAGSDIVFDAAIRRAGMLRVDTLQDLFMAAETLARISRNRDEVLTLMTNGGGAGVMAADAAALLGVPLARLSDGLRATLDAALPPIWSRANPIDIIGDAPVRRYTETLAALLADRACGAVLFMHAPSAIVGSADIARACAPLVREAPGRVLACWLGGDSVAEAKRLFEDAGAADYDTPEEAVRAFDLLRTYRRNQALLLEAPTASENGPPDIAAARGVITGALADGREMLDELEAKAVLAAYGIPVVTTVACEPTAEAAVAVVVGEARPAVSVAAADQAHPAAGPMAYPVALKILSPDISHKSDVGGVRLNLRNEAELRGAADAMLARVQQLRPNARISGFTVQTMAARPMARELIVGASIDPLFGPVLLFGQGGTAVEVLADRAIALPPLNRVLARELISRTRVAKLMAGYRDHPAVDEDAVCDVLIALSQMLADLPELAELDINPLWADHDGVLALDARLRVSREAGAGAGRFAIAPYPAELIETIAWRGEMLLLRPIRPEDEPQHKAFIDRLAPDDLRLRFFSVRREMPRSELARLAQIDYAREMAFIAVRTLPDGSGETLGVVRAVCDPDNVDAEFALIVRSDVKGQGLGDLLLGKMVGHLSNRSTQRMACFVLRENSAMQALIRSHGFSPDAGLSDTDALYFVRALKPTESACSG